MPCSQTFVYLVLAGLLLYNPFLALIHSHTGLSMQDLPRNRATVGSSELQHFSPVTNALTADIVAARCMGNIVPVLQEKEFHLAIDATPSTVILRDFSSNLWFRPPPSA